MVRSLPGLESVEAAVRTGVQVIRKGRMRPGPLAADLLERSDEYLLVFDAPGVEEEDVQVRYLDGSVLVRIDRFRGSREDYEAIVSGRLMSLDGQVILPDDAEIRPDDAEATLRRDGTLEIRLPKHESIQPEESTIVDE